MPLNKPLAPIKVATYMPHGDIPDQRGYAPSLVAQYLVSNLTGIQNYFIANNENNRPLHEETDFGTVFRIRESAIYRRLFRKITKLDPYPLHVRMARIVEKNPVDIIHSHQLELPNREVLNKLSSCKPKIITHVHTIRSFDSSLGISDMYLAVSKHIRNQMVYEKGFPKERVEVLHNGVDTDIFQPAHSTDELNNIRKQLNISTAAKVLGFVGRKQEIKGYFEYLCCVEKFSNQDSSVIGLCVGPQPGNAKYDPLFTKYSQLEKMLIKQGKLICLEALTHKKLSKIYKAIDILIFATRSEPQGMVAIESISSGCITIASAVGGIPETIIDKECGFLIQNPTSLEEIFSIVSNCLTNLQELTPIRENARKRAVEHFSWSSQGEKLQKIYNSI